MAEIDFATHRLLPHMDWKQVHETVMTDPFATSADREADTHTAFRDVSRRPVSGDIGDAPCHVRALYEWWQRSRGKDIPCRSDFDIIEHFRLAPHLFMLHRLEKNIWEYRLNGEEVVRLMGTSQRGMVFSTSDASAELAAFARYLEQVAESRTAWVCRGSLGFRGKDFLSFASVDCPLSGPDGTVDTILGALQLRS